MLPVCRCGLSTNSLELASTLYETAHVAIRLSAAGINTIRLQEKQNSIVLTLVFLVEGGGLESAVGMLSRCLEIREKRLGRFHHDTAQTKLDLAVNLIIVKL